MTADPRDDRAAIGEWAATFVMCGFCHHKWAAVHEAETPRADLQCPRCYHSGETFRIPIPRPKTMDSPTIPPPGAPTDPPVIVIAPDTPAQAWRKRIAAVAAVLVTVTSALVAFGVIGPGALATAHTASEWLDRNWPVLLLAYTTIHNLLSPSIGRLFK